MSLFGALFARRSGRERILTDGADLPKLIRNLSSLSEDQYGLFVLQNPALLSKRRISKLMDLHGRQIERKAGLRNAVYFIDVFRIRLVQDVDEYPLGSGPIEALGDRHIAGEISLNETLREASSQKVVFHLSPVYVAALSRASERMAASKAWRQAITRQRLVLAAVDGLKPYTELDEFKMRCEADLSWLNVVRRAIAIVPNGEIYADAMCRGQALAELAQRRGDSDERASALHGMGALNLDPYSVGRSSPYALWYSQWLKMARDEFGDVAGGRIIEKLPPPKDALEQAVDLFTRAGQLRTGRQLGRTLKALAQAQAVLHEIGGNVDPHSVVETVRIASELLDPSEDEEPLRVATAIGRHFEMILDEKEKQSHSIVQAQDDGRNFEKALQLAKSVLSGQWDGEVDQNTVLGMVSAAMTGPLPQLFDRLTIFKAADILAREFAAGDRLVRFVHTECVNMLVRAFGNDLDFAVPEDTHDLTKALNEKAALKNWPDKADIFARVAIASRLTSVNREDLSLKIIDAASKSGDVWLRWLPAFASFPAGLHTGVAVNAFNVGNLQGAIKSYLLGFSEYLQTDIPSAATDVLYRTIDVVRQLKSIELADFLTEVASPILNAERISDTAVQYAHQLCRELLAASQRSGSMDFREVFLLFQLAKGLRFGELVGVGSLSSLRVTADDYKHVDAISTLEATTAESRSVPNASVSDSILCSYLSVGEPTSGEDDAGKIRNLRHNFDLRQVDKMISTTRPSLANNIRVLAGLDNLLGSEDVLLSYYFGSGQNRKQAIFCLLMTSTSSSLVVHDDLAEWGDEVDIAGNIVMQTRTTVVQDPYGGGRVSGDGAKALDALGFFMFPPDIRKLLREKRAEGKKHLCIIPHHATHFCPLHLAHLNAEELLADDWVVTYASNLTVLNRTESAPELKRSEIAAFGISFSTRRGGQAALPEAEAEAKEIAWMFREAPILNREATHERVFEALRTSKRVHIASHGQHNAEAPAFQCIYLEDGGHARPLLAFELQGMDFSGLDLVSLSACETSLGRVDLMDNLRGLTANLFMAGVKTVVGTLWPVETNAAQTFFVEFYKSIAQGGCKLNAFEHAQKSTRERFPQYRDWGAFYLNGAWQ